MHIKFVLVINYSPSLIMDNNGVGLMVNSSHSSMKKTCSFQTLVFWLKLPQDSLFLPVCTRCLYPKQWVARVTAVRLIFFQRVRPKWRLVTFLITMQVATVAVMRDTMWWRLLEFSFMTVFPETKDPLFIPIQLWFITRIMFMWQNED